MHEKIETVKNNYLNKIKDSSSLKELDEIYIELFGKSGQITLLAKELPKIPKDEVKVVAPLFNRVKNELEKAVNNRRVEVREEGYAKLEDEKLKLNEIATSSTTPRNDEQGESEKSENLRIGKKRIGHLHPLTQFENRIAELFEKLDFQQYDAPHIDTDYNVYEVLNIPKNSPARDLQDTLYVDPSNLNYTGDPLILRGHTSNSEVRFMKEFKTPHRMMLMGRCFRYENLDARHEHTFDQFEIVYIERHVNMANLQFLSEYFLKAVFGTEIKARLRTKYYPQVEPGAGIDGLCIFCKGEGCKVCGGVGWLELGGAGMIHPVALKNGGIDPEIYSGLAWGISPERMAMLIYGVEDIRLFRSGDLEFLEKF